MAPPNIQQSEDRNDSNVEYESDKSSKDDSSEVGGVLVDVANSKPLTALFGPAFTALGQYWGERMQETVAQWREKREANERYHVDRVLDVEGPPAASEAIDEALARLTAAWQESAQQVDPLSEDDNGLSALWQAVLGRIYDRDAEASEMMTALQALSAREAKLLLAVGRGMRPRADDVAPFLKMTNLGLVRPNTFADYLDAFRTFPLGRGGPYQLLTLAVTVYGVGLIVFGLLYSQYSSSDNITSALANGSIVVGIILSLLPIVLSSGTYTLTSLGGNLQKHGLRYLKRSPA